LQDIRLRLDRRLLSAAPPANTLAPPHRPGPQVCQAAADHAAGDSGRTRNRGSATASGARFTCGEQPPVSLIEEGAECIEANLDGIGVDHSARLGGKALDALPFFRVRLFFLRCRFYSCELLV
jgi:hypothetical protein